MTCPECGHKHQGSRLAGICIGCPCPVVYEDCVECMATGNDPERAPGEVKACPNCGGSGVARIEEDA